MSNCLKRNIAFLRFLEEAKNGNQIQAVLKSATPSQVQAISEICNHVICGHCKLDKKILGHFERKNTGIEKSRLNKKDIRK